MTDQPQDQQKGLELRWEALSRQHLSQVPLKPNCFQVFFPLPEMKLGSFPVPVAMTKHLLFIVHWKCVITTTKDWFSFIVKPC